MFRRERKSSRYYRNTRCFICAVFYQKKTIQFRYIIHFNRHLYIVYYLSVIQFFDYFDFSSAVLSDRISLNPARLDLTGRP